MLKVYAFPPDGSTQSVTVMDLATARVVARDFELQGMIARIYETTTNQAGDEIERLIL